MTLWPSVSSSIVSGIAMSPGQVSKGIPSCSVSLWYPWMGGFSSEVLEVRLDIVRLFVCGTVVNVGAGIARGHRWEMGNVGVVMVSWLLKRKVRNTGSSYLSSWGQALSCGKERLTKWYSNHTHVGPIV